jgi:hypothetical protein
VTTELLKLIPVIPSQDIGRDILWYEQHAGFLPYYSDRMYAVIYREGLVLHLQWHADTKDDPLLGGSVVRIHVINIRPIFEEFVERGTVSTDALRIATPWNTNEFGFYDLNNNAIFVMEDAGSAPESS